MLLLAPRVRGYSKTHRVTHVKDANAASRRHRDPIESRAPPRGARPARALAPALVLLHEGLGSVRLWRDFPAALADATGARVVAFSRFGHGDSDPPPRPRTPRFMHEEALDVLPRRARARSRSPSPSSSATATAPRSRSSTRPRTRCARSSRSRRTCSSRRCASPRSARPSAPTRRAGCARGWPATTATPTPPSTAGTTSGSHPEFPRWDIEDVLPGITCPLLLIQGEDDQYGTHGPARRHRARASPVRSSACTSPRGTRRTSRRPRQTLAAIARLRAPGRRPVHD